jgi:hypothetical protein
MFKKKTKKNATDKSNIEKVVTETPTNDNQPDRLIPLNKWHEHHLWPPIGGMRHIRFLAEEKKATHCFIKKGSRVLVKELTFLDWASTNDAL